MRMKDPTSFHKWKEQQRCPEDPDAEGYGMAPFVRAERWADLMEARMAANPDEPFEKIAEETERQAGRNAEAEDAVDSHLTGFQFGCVVAIMAECWTEGDALRRWHNQKWGVAPENDDGGGVVNPALMTIELPDDAEGPLL